MGGCGGCLPGPAGPRGAGESGRELGAAMQGLRSTDDGSRSFTAANIKDRTRDPGREFSDFYSTDVYEPLGKGAFADVYKTTQMATSTACAVKIMSKQKVKDLEQVASELLTLVALDHPHVLKLYDFFEDAHSIYVVTELATGGDLSHAYTDNLPLVPIWMQIMLALSYCHNRQLAHRDLKLENVLFTDVKRDRIKVIDFGFATLKKIHSTEITQIVGTPDFMSPEIIQILQSGKGHYTTQTDLWSAGIMLYVVLSGLHPFGSSAGGSMEDFHAKIMRTPVPDAPLNQPDVPRGGRDLVRLMLEKDPNKRPTAAKILEHPWLKQTERVHTASQQDRRAMKRVLRFGQVSRFEQVLMTIAAHNSYAQELEELHQNFMDFDMDGDGLLSRQDIVKGLEMAGIDMESEDLDAVFEVFQDPTNGSIQYTEWLAATLRPDTLTSERAIKAAFEFFDRNGNGACDRADLLNVLDEASADDLLQQWASTDGTLDLQAFSAAINHLAQQRNALELGDDLEGVPKGRASRTEVRPKLGSPVAADRLPHISGFEAQGDDDAVFDAFRVEKRRAQTVVVGNTFDSDSDDDIRRRPLRQTVHTDMRIGQKMQAATQLSRMARQLRTCGFQPQRQAKGAQRKGAQRNSLIAYSAALPSQAKAAPRKSLIAYAASLPSQAKGKASRSYDV